MEPKKADDPDELGGWRINGRLGEGGFGTVFLAEKGAQKAAIKVIRKEFVAEDDARARLATEAKVLSSLSDPSIGKILDSDLFGELPWIATEFINGPTLEDKVKYEGPLEEIAWFNLAANIFHAIVSANELGIIHKDIKPSNIILGETGNKLIDFGIAHISGQTRTANFGDREGSTPYSSPEHFTIRTNPKMDVFSTASTLVFAGKGSSAWKGTNDLQLMRSINDDAPDFEGLTENQIDFLTPLFEKNPSDRKNAIEARNSALMYIEYLIGKRNKPLAQKNNTLLKYLINTKIKFSKNWFRIRSKTVRILILLIAIIASSLVLNNLFGYIFWTIAFLLVPVGILLLSIRTYKRGLGKAQWGRRSVPKAIAIVLISLLMPIVLMLTTLIFSLTVPLYVRDIVGFISPKNESTSQISEQGTQSAESVQILPGQTQSEATENVEKTTISSPASINLTPQQRAKQEACVRISFEKKYLEANVVCLELAKIGDAKSQYALGYNYDQLGKKADSEFWMKKAAAQNWPEALAGLAWREYKSKNLKLATTYATKAADLGSASALNTLGVIAEDQGRWNEAVNWYKKAWDLKEVWGGINLGNIYESHFKDNLTAEKWYLAAAKTSDGEAEYVYGNFLRTTFSKNLESCGWFKKSSDHEWKEGKSAYSKYCVNAQPMPSPSSTKEFTPSAPLAKGVITKDIFGRVFDAGIDWNVPLTTYLTEPVPAISGLQFRLLGYTNKVWLDIPYKLKKTDYGVQAQVDQLVISMILNKKVCPEFRFVREVSGEITNVWSPGLPECSNDYVP